MRTLMPAKLTNNAEVWVESVVSGTTAHLPDNGGCEDMMAAIVTGRHGHEITAVQAYAWLRVRWCSTCWPAGKADR